MVALHEGRPAEVPRLICETREDKIRFMLAKFRRETRDVHRAVFNDRRAELEALSPEALENEFSGQ